MADSKKIPKKPKVARQAKSEPKDQQEEVTEGTDISRKAMFKKYKKLCIASQKSPFITVAESLRSMNGVVRLMVKKYGSESIFSHTLFCEPSRERLGFSTIARSDKLLKTNHFPGMKPLVRKGPLSQQINAFRELFPKEFEFYPQSWDLSKPLEVKALRRQFDASKTYILKPSSGHQGDGILLAQDWSQVAEYLKYTTRVIAQEYIARPLLLDGFKFDFRVYVMVESLSPLKIHVFREGLARFCVQKYVEPTRENLMHDYMHLTNYSLNKKADGFKEAEATSPSSVSSVSTQGDDENEEDDEEGDSVERAKPFDITSATEAAEDFDATANKRRLTTALRQIDAEYAEWLKAHPLPKAAPGVSYPTSNLTFRCASDEVEARISAEIAHAKQEASAKEKKATASSKAKKAGGKQAQASKSSQSSQQKAEDHEAESGDVKGSAAQPVQTDIDRDPSFSSDFEKYFWAQIDAIVSKTLLSMWRPLWTKYSATFPEDQRVAFHLPTCPNKIRASSSTSSSSKSEEQTEEDEEHRGSKSSKLTATASPSCSCAEFSRSFHIIGFDILLDDEFRPWLLEVNNNPSMHCRRSVLDGVIKQGVFETSLRLLGVLSSDQIREVNSITSTSWHPLLSKQFQRAVQVAQDQTSGGAPKAALQAVQQLVMKDSAVLVPAERRFVTLRPVVTYPEIGASPLNTGEIAFEPLE